MARTRVDVEHNDGEMVQTSVHKKLNWVFPFIPVGKKSMRNPKSLDALDIICEFDKSELFVLSQVKSKITQNHEVTLSRADFTSNEQRKLQKGIKSFLDKALMVRLKREHYAVNPYFLTPPIALHEKIKSSWESVYQNRTL